MRTKRPWNFGLDGVDRNSLIARPSRLRTLVRKHARIPRLALKFALAVLTVRAHSRLEPDRNKTTLLACI